ncbi:MAG: hypothetical protein ACE5GI_04430, partial [Candidatus Aminicenantales bacterium]
KRGNNYVRHLSTLVLVSPIKKNKIAFSVLTFYLKQVLKQNIISRNKSVSSAFCLFYSNIFHDLLFNQEEVWLISGVFFRQIC